MNFTVTKVEAHHYGNSDRGMPLHYSDYPAVIAYIDFAGIARGWPFTIPIAALDTRKAIYGLEHDHEAFDAIIREFGFSHDFIYDLQIKPIREIDPSCEYLDWHKEVTPVRFKPQGPEKFHHFGGLHDEITVVYAGDASAQRDAELGKHARRQGLPPEYAAHLRAKALAPAKPRTPYSGSVSVERPPEKVELEAPAAEPATPAMPDPDQGLAERILSEVRGNPQRTTRTLSQSLKEPEGRVRRALEEFAVTGDTVTHVGPGGGGGWLDV